MVQSDQAASRGSVQGDQAGTRSSSFGTGRASSTARTSSSMASKALSDAVAAETDSSVRGSKAALSAEAAAEMELLAKLPPSKPKKRRPGQAWDGRVAGLSVKEFRDLKWSLEASFGKVERRGPAYTCRPHCPMKSRSAPDVLLDTDVYKAFNKTQTMGPCYSAGLASFPNVQERSQGPAQYTIPSSMDPGSHPTFSKDTGRKFGTERLLANDEASPAPGDHDVSNFNAIGRFRRQPNYSITGREAWREPTKAPGPAMGEYQFDNITRTGKMSPIKWNMQGKNELSEPPFGATELRLRKKVDAMKKKHKFEVELNYDKVAPILLSLDGPAPLNDVFAALQANTKLVRDPNTFLVSTAMKHLGSGAGTGSRSVPTPGPGHNSLVSVPKERSPEWRFGSEHRGLA